MSIAYGNFSNYGFIKDSVPAELLEELKAEIAELDLENRLIEKLAGNLESSYLLEKSRTNLEKYVVNLAQAYAAGFNISFTGKNLTGDNLSLRLFWANFQKKHEFNPIHLHDGDFSFVIWLKVPYDINDELATSISKNSNVPRAGMFSFFYTNVFGEIREAEFPVDKQFEGNIFLFPSCLQHMVYPFTTSDDLRISISGNIKRNE
jgi:hypothetical protein